MYSFLPIVFLSALFFCMYVLSIQAALDPGLAIIQ